MAHGYDHFLHDNDAWKWLSFTAITLKVLDMVDEQAQREHEAAPVGEKLSGRLRWQQVMY